MASRLRGEMDEVRKWNGRLEARRAVRSQEIENDWRRIVLQYEKQHPANVTADDIRVNLAFPAVKIFLRSSVASRPYIYVNPLRPEWGLASEAFEFLINDAWRLQGRKKILRRIVLDAIILKVGYAMTHLKINKITGEYESFMTRVSPVNLWTDGALSVDDSYYLIRKVILPWKTANKRWPKANLPPAGYEEVRNGIESELDSVWQNLEESDGVAKVQDDMAKCVVYETHDQLNGEISVFHPQYDRYLIQPRPSPYTTRSLITELVFNEKLFSHYGISDLEPVEKQQNELDRVREQMLTHNKRFNRKYKTAKNNLDSEAKAALESGEDGAIVEMNDPDQFDPISDASLSGDVYTYHAMIRGDHREIIGLNEYDMSSAIPRTKTAYETEQIVRGGQARKTEKSDLVEDFVKEITYKDIEVMKTFYSTERVVRLLGPEGYIWQQIQASDLKGQHIAEVQHGSTRPKDEASNFQRGLLLYNQFKDDTLVNPHVLRDVVFRLMNIQHRRRLLNQPEPGGQPGQQGGMLGLNPASAQMPNPADLAKSLQAPSLQNLGNLRG